MWSQKKSEKRRGKRSGARSWEVCGADRSVPQFTVTFTGVQGLLSAPLEFTEVTS